MAIERRVWLLLAAFLTLLGVAAARSAYLGVVRASSLQGAAARQQVATVDVPAARGTITDRHGVELAVSEPAADIAANPFLIKDPLGVARRLAPLLAQPEGTLLSKLTDRDHGFIYLVRQLPAARAVQIERLKIEGIQSIASSRRSYPERWLASQLLGTVGIDGNGLGGIEYSQDSVLGGHDGERRLVKDALGRPISFQELRDARPGRSIQLTLDARIQEEVENVLAQVGHDFQPKGATALVMDPRTGEVLALANWPRVDAANVAGAPAYARMDRAIGASYEPGSTFKAFTVSGALENGTVTPQSSFDLAPQIQVADRTIGESHPRGPVRLTTAQILAQSSNVGAVTIGLRLGRRQFDRWVRRFGFARPTGIDLPGEQAGIVPRLDQYSGASMGNLPIGQGLAVTPIQMAAAYAAIANGGILHAPHVVKAIDGKVVPPRRGRRAISSATASSVREMLEGVLAPGGTASEVSVPGYKLAGKTGTAEKPDPRTGGYSKYNVVASFVGFAPAQSPKLLVAVMVDEPRGETAGGVVAAPAFGKIAAFALAYLRIPPG